MKYFWISPLDQRADHWMFFNMPDDAGRTLQPKYSEFQCRKCKKIDEVAALEAIPPRMRVRSKRDFFRTHDGVLCLSPAAQRPFNDGTIDGLRLIPIEGGSDYAVAMPKKFAPANADKSGMEFHDKCPDCGRFRETCLSPFVESFNTLQKGCVLVCPGINMESIIGRDFWFLASESAVEVLRTARLTGCEFRLAD